jgi:hypothetical protein
VADWHRPRYSPISVLIHGQLDGPDFVSRLFVRRLIDLFEVPGPEQVLGNFLAGQGQVTKILERLSLEFFRHKLLLYVEKSLHE